MARVQPAISAALSAAPSSLIDRVGDRHDVAAVGDLIAERGKRCLELGDPQRFRAHDAAAAAGADVDRRADQVDIAICLQPCPHLFDAEYRVAACAQIDEKLAI